MATQNMRNFSQKTFSLNLSLILKHICFVFFLQARSRACVVFDLSRYRDFSLEFLDQKDNGKKVLDIVENY